MNFKSIFNEFLRLRPGVILTQATDAVIFDLDAYFKQANLKATVTSVLRDSDAQVKIIRNELFTRGLYSEYREAWGDIKSKIDWDGEQVYCWQPGWSKLLNLGFVVNPPFAAKVLMDYYRPGSTVNKKGNIIQESPHTKGLAFDISGGKDGVSEEANVIAGAMGMVSGLKGFLIERNNNCVHVDCLPIIQNI